MLQVGRRRWRPDLQRPADLVEEVVRLEGYDKIPSVLPTPPPGRGLTGAPAAAPRGRRARSPRPASTEVLSYPFVAPRSTTRSGWRADDPRRRAARLVNPLSDAEPELRTSLLPGLLASLLRNLGRGNRDLALFEMGLVFLPGAGPAAGAAAGRRPTARPTPSSPRSTPRCPTSRATSPSVWPATSSGRAGGAPGRPATWADAIEAARRWPRRPRVELEVRAGRVRAVASGPLRRAAARRRR